METLTAASAIAAMVAVVIVTGMHASRNDRRRRLLHEERMAAIEKGVPIPEDADIEAERTPRAGREPALQGTVLTALGLGLLAASHLVPREGLPKEQQGILAFLEVWAYPATFVGIALLVFAFFSRKGKR